MCLRKRTTVGLTQRSGVSWVPARRPRRLGDSGWSSPATGQQPTRTSTSFAPRLALSPPPSCAARDRSMRMRKDTQECPPNHPEADMWQSEYYFWSALLLECSASGVLCPPEAVLVLPYVCFWMIRRTIWSVFSHSHRSVSASAHPRDSRSPCFGSDTPCWPGHAIRLRQRRENHTAGRGSAEAAP